MCAAPDRRLVESTGATELSRLGWSEPMEAYVNADPQMQWTDILKCVHVLTHAVPHTHPASVACGRRDDAALCSCELRLKLPQVHPDERGGV